MKLDGEIFLSEIRQKRVMDKRGHSLGTLMDLSVRAGESFPLVEGFLVARGKERFLLPWEEVEVLNRELLLCRSNEGNGYPPPPTEGIYAFRDLMDKQIVDINGAKVVRVNDVKVKEMKGELTIIAVDVGFRGLLRRMGVKRRLGRYWKGLVSSIPYRLIGWQYIQPLEPSINHLVLKLSKEQTVHLHPSELAEILTQIPAENQDALLDSMDIDKIADTIPEMDDKNQVALVERMTTEKAADILEAMSPDDAADILGDLSDKKAEEIIEEMEEEDAQEVKDLLQHEEDSAGGLMTTEYFAVTPFTPVAETFSQLRTELEDVETINDIYVIDEGERLMGSLTLRELFLRNGEDKVAQFMHRRLIFLTPESDGMEAARMMAKFNLLSLPVVDKEKRLLGIITVDDILEFLLPSVKKRKRF